MQLLNLLFSVLFLLPGQALGDTFPLSNEHCTMTSYRHVYQRAADLKTSCWDPKDSPFGERSKLDLSLCLANEGGELVAQERGGFIKSCTRCEVDGETFVLRCICYDGPNKDVYTPSFDLRGTDKFLLDGYKGGVSLSGTVHANVPGFSVGGGGNDLQLGMVSNKK
ncbi:hypothetical protein MKZ38_006243 [Zalerion maritima]|uniref:Cyanovirin-N domain-containing protein n=1 Tax=Zalerion maritima TaxID=339359 RepID=A0AAD5WQF2_9PEZI|nr:hypothetical protein MKZ38_006243 [Zalerion maritima]